MSTASLGQRVKADYSKRTEWRKKNIIGFWAVV